MLQHRSGSSFQLIKPRRGRLQTDHSESEEEEDVGIESPSAESQAPALFSCPEEGGVRVNMRYKNLENHLACGNHKRISDKETFHDKTKILYGERVYLLVSDQSQVLVHLYLMYQLMELHQKDGH